MSKILKYTVPVSRNMIDKEKVVWGSQKADAEHGETVVQKAYDWAIGNDGTIYGLVAGDMGYDATHIVIPEDHARAFVEWFIANRMDLTPEEER